MWRIRDNIYWLALLLLLCWASVIGSVSAAETMYQISEAELTQLEANNRRQSELLTQLEIQLIASQQESATLQTSTKVLRTQLTASNNQVTALQQDLQTAQQSLQKSKQSMERAQAYLQAYEKEARKTQQRLRRQRTMWAVVAGVLAYTVIQK